MAIEKYLRGSVYWWRGRPADTGDYDRGSLRTSDPDIAEAKIRAIEAAARKRAILGPDAPKVEDEITFAAVVVLYPATPTEARYLKPIVRRIGKKRVRELTPEFVRQLAKQMYPYASTDTWQRQVVTPIRSVINNGHDLGKCPPIRIRAFSREDRQRQDRIRGKESRKPKKPGSWPWLLAFMEHADPRDAACAYFMFNHGARITQAISMDRESDMDLSNARLRIPPAKGHPAEWVDIDPELVAMIANLPPPYRKVTTKRVFFIGGGRNAAIYRRWQTACELAGIEYLPPHAAGRHGFGTEMIVRQRVDAVSAAREGRWSNPVVMMNTYSHPEGSKEAVRDAFRRGKEAASTPPVQTDSGKRVKVMKSKRKGAAS
jgi:integrase